MRRLIAIVALLGCLTPAGLCAQVETKANAVVLHGSASNCSQPAQIDYKKVAKKTEEHKTIRSEGVRKDSARYNLLTSKMKKRIKAACKKVAKEGGHDCVVRKGDVKDAKGRAVVDVTDEVIEALESADTKP